MDLKVPTRRIKRAADSSRDPSRHNSPLEKKASQPFPTFRLTESDRRQQDALTVFGAHQDDVVNILYDKFVTFREIKDDSSRELLEQEVNAVLERSDKAVEATDQRIPQPRRPSLPA